MSLAGCDRVFDLTRPPADAFQADGDLLDAIDAPPGTCDWGTMDAIRATEAKGTSIVAGHFNNDEYIDLAVGTTSALFVFYNSSAGLETPQMLNLMGPIHALAVGNIDNDSLDDLAVAGMNASALLATGTSWDVRSYTFQMSASTAIAIANLDGTGLADLVVTRPGSQIATVLLGGATTYTHGQDIVTQGGATSIAVADYDGDTDPDLIMGLADIDSVSLHPDAGADFIQGPVLAVGTGPSAVAVARLGTRQVLDIVAANEKTHDVTVLRNNGSGAFTSVEVLGVDMEPVALQIADLDQDGTPDILTANNKSNSISLLRGTATGFEPARMYETVAKPVAFAVADLDDDTHLDLAVLGESGFVVHRAVCQ